MIKMPRSVPISRVPAVSILKFATALALMAPGCSLLQTVPVTEQSYLQYQIRDDYGGTKCVTLRFRNAARNMIEVIVEQPKTPEPLQTPDDEFSEAAAYKDFLKTASQVIDPDDDNKILVSKFFTRKGGGRLGFNHIGPLWLPKAALSVGRSLDLEYPAGDVVVEKQSEWNGRSVMALQRKNGEGADVLYYSAATGFLVGYETGNSAEGKSGEPQGPSLALTETNIDGLLSAGR